MKKRKIKLFASVASLAMVAAVMGVGVWAATQQAVNITSNVSFSGSAIAANVGMKLEAFEQGESALLATTMLKNGEAKIAENTTITDNAITEQIATFTLAEQASTKNAAVTVALADTDDNSVINAGSQIIYTITIAPQANTAGIYYHVAMTAAADKANDNFTQIQYKVGTSELQAFTVGQTTITNTSDEAGVAYAAENANDVVITFVFTTPNLITNIDATSELNLPNISVKLNSDKSKILTDTYGQA